MSLIYCHADAETYRRVVNGEQNEIYIDPNEVLGQDGFICELMYREMQEGTGDGTCIVELQNWGEDGTMDDTRHYEGRLVVSEQREYHPEWGCPKRGAYIIEIGNMIPKGQIPESKSTRTRPLRLIGDVFKPIWARVREVKMCGSVILK